MKQITKNEIYNHYIALDWSKVNFAIASVRGNGIKLKVEEHPPDLKLLKSCLKNLPGNPGNSRTLFNNEFYFRGIDEKELAIYNDSTLLQWNVYGLDNVGKLVGSKKYYYMKDHLGSVRATLDEERNTVSAQDYDMWGYILDDRTYESNESVYKFTSKERDEETAYDYFGARYYDSRIGRWGQVEPKFENEYSISPYGYVSCNPLKFIDPNGEFKISAAVAENYKKLAYYLEHNIQDIANNEKIMNALETYTGFSKSQIKDALVWGEGPEIHIEDLGNSSEGTHILGSFSGKINPDKINISLYLAKNLEHATGKDNDVYLFWTAVTILHEFIHYGVHHTKPENYVSIAEEGYAFEIEAYGRVIGNYNAAVDVLNLNNERKKMIRRYYPEFRIEESIITP